MDTSDFKNHCIYNLDEFAKKGLRTLMFAQKQVFNDNLND